MHSFHHFFNIAITTGSACSEPSVIACLPYALAVQMGLVSIFSNLLHLFNHFFTKGDIDSGNTYSKC